jgi:glucose/mannose transport system substrate-binding protein
MRSPAVAVVSLAAALAALALGPAACGDTATDSGSGDIEIFSWWTAGGEANALGELLRAFGEGHPDARIIETAATGSSNARATLRDRMIGGQPPDTFQANGGWDLLRWVLYNGRSDTDSKMEPVDDLALAQDWTNVIPRPVLETVSFGGHTYAVPLNVHRVNTVFFNKRLFAMHAVKEPASLEELFAVADALRAQNVTPIALGRNDPWTLALMLFENIFVARAGGAAYRELFLGRGDAFSPEIRAAVEDLRRLLSYANASAPALTWSEAVELVRTGEAAMTIMGDWAKGYFTARGDVPDTDFGVIPMPGTAGTFVFTTDTFGLPRGARNRRGALALLELFGSEEGQDLFNPIKGSISARSDARREAYDMMAQGTITDFQAAAADPTRLVPATAMLAPPEFIDAVEGALGQFAEDGNASVVLHTIDNWSDVLRSSPWR